MSGSRYRSLPIPSFPARVRHLCVVLGDQLDRHSSIFDSFDPTRDLLFMAEVRNESLHVPSHRQRTAVFLSAMRHFAEEQWAEGRPLRYVDLEDPENTQSLQGEISRALEIHRPEAMVAVLPGDWRVQRELESAGRVAGVPLWFLDDRHFTVTPEEYKNWLGSKKAPRMEFFYRWQRQRHGILMDGDLPVLGRWNFDAENRDSVRDPRHRKAIPTRYECPPDAVTEEVLETVARNFPDNPGRLESFAWPVTPDQGRAVLHNFIEQRLPLFGRYQDAMLTDEAWMWHSHVSVALNLKLIHPTECIEAAELAWREGRAPIESVEGFVRQILGWREFIRCVYYHEGPDYGQRNELAMEGQLPSIYWTGKTTMRCMSQCIGQTLEHGYAHHIQRLMVTGNFALIAGIHPRAISDWYLAVYVDAVDWVTLPNTLGMVMHADGGVVGSKPYAASGRYIDRMSDYCKGCIHNPGERTGTKACPFTTLYWDFLMRTRSRFGRNPRMATILKNLDRFGPDECARIQDQAHQIRRSLGIL
jgi:deoxyribodipyrimidine photolyase-related protein